MPLSNWDAESVLTFSWIQDDTLRLTTIIVIKYLNQPPSQDSNDLRRFRMSMYWQHSTWQQSIQHPLAKNWVELEAARLMVMKAAWLYDNGRECGAEANAAKYFAAEAGFRACEQAILTHGGMGYSKEFHVERYLREIMIPRIAPVSREMILSYIAERVLGLPKSY